jgi:hypothetical protein
MKKIILILAIAHIAVVSYLSDTAAVSDGSGLRLAADSVAVSGMNRLHPARGLKNVSGYNRPSFAAVSIREKQKPFTKIEEILQGSK